MIISYDLLTVAKRNAHGRVKSPNEVTEMNNPKDIPAIERLAAYIKVLEADWNDPTNPPTYRGGDWWQLSEKKNGCFRSNSQTCRSSSLRGERTNSY